MSEKFLAGRVAMVTGGASGMGRASGLALAGAGADVAIGSLLAGGDVCAGELSHLPRSDVMEKTKGDRGDRRPAGSRRPARRRWR